MPPASMSRVPLPPLLRPTVTWPVAKLVPVLIVRLWETPFPTINGDGIAAGLPFVLWVMNLNAAWSRQDMNLRTSIFNVPPLPSDRRCLKTYNLTRDCLQPVQEGPDGEFPPVVGQLTRKHCRRSHAHYRGAKDYRVSSRFGPVSLLRSWPPTRR